MYSVQTVFGLLSVQLFTCLSGCSNVDDSADNAKFCLQGRQCRCILELLCQKCAEPAWERTSGSCGDGSVLPPVLPYPQLDPPFPAAWTPGMHICTHRGKGVAFTSHAQLTSFAGSSTAALFCLSCLANTSCSSLLAQLMLPCALVTACISNLPRHAVLLLFSTF